MNQPEGQQAAKRSRRPTQEDESDLGYLRDYRLLGKLGRGGMGTVYHAFHTHLQREVAVKVLPPEKTRSAEAVARFKRETLAIGKLDHPNIVRAQDAGEVDGRHFLVMEHVAGFDLSTVTKRLGPLSVADACELVRQAALGLQCAHEHGMVHRDIKPSNLMVTPEGQVKILDLGLALLSEPLPETSELTGEGQVMGTLDYMAPEQLGDSHAVDHRADIYSLGATLYRLLTGRAPYTEKRYNTPTKKLFAIATKPYRPVQELRGDVPHDVIAILNRMMAKDPDKRYATAAEITTALTPRAAGSDLFELVRKATAQTAPSEQSSDGTFDSHGSTSQLEGTDAVPARRRNVIGPWAAVAVVLFVVIGALTFFHGTGGKAEPVSDVDNHRVTPVLEKHGLIGRDKNTGREYPVRQPGETRFGDPLCRSAFVTKPAKLPGVASWTVVTREPMWAEPLIRYSPDGTLLAAGSLDGVIRLRTPDTGELRRALVGHNGRILALDWSPDGQLLATGGTDHTVRIWDVASGNQLNAIRGITARIRGLAWLPDGEMLASISEDNMLRVWDTTKCESSNSFPVERPRAIDCTSNGSAMIAVGDAQGGITVWDAVNMKPFHRFDTGQTVDKLEWSPDSGLLASTANSSDSMISVWDIYTLKLVSEIDAPGAMAWSPDSKSILAAGNIWDAKSATHVQTIEPLEYPFENVDWSMAGDNIVVESDATMYLCNLNAAADIRVRRSHPTQTHTMASTFDNQSDIAWANDARTVFSGAFHASDDLQEGPVSLCYWRISDGRLQRSDRKRFLPRSPPFFRPISVSRGEYLAHLETEDPKRFVIRDVATGRRVQNFSGHVDKICHLSFSPDSRFIVSTGDDKTVRVWDIESGEEKLKLTQPIPFWSAMMSPSGELIATTGQLGVRLWDAETGDQRHYLKVAAPSLVAFSAESKSLAVAAPSGEIQLWDVASAKRIKTIETVGPSPLAMQWLDKSTVITWDEENIVRYYDTSSDRLAVKTVELPGATLAGAAFSADGSMIALAADDVCRTVRLDNGRTRTHIALQDGQYLTLSEGGHYVGSLGVEELFVYVVQTETGQETLTPTEFAKKYEWENDPHAVLWDFHDRSKRSQEDTLTQATPSGEPIRPMALVTRPAKIEGISSWSIETVVPRGDKEWDQQGGPAISPDGKLFAIATADGVMRIYESSSGRLVHAWLCHPGSGWGVEWSPDQQFLATIAGGGSEDDQDMVRVWEYPTGRLIDSIVLNSAHCIAWSPQRPLLAVGGESLHLWEPSGEKQAAGVPSDESIECLAWSPQGDLVAMGGDRIRLWHVGEKRIIRTLEPTEGSGGTHSIRQLAWSPDGGTLASGTADRVVRLWNPTNGELLRSLKADDHFDGLAWCGDGTTLALSHESSIRFWDATAGEKLERKLDLHTIASPGAHIRCSPDGATLAALVPGGGIRVYDLRDDTLQVRLDEVKTTVQSWCPTGELMFTTKSTDSDSGYPGFLLWEINAGEKWRIADDLPNNGWGEWSPDGHLFAISRHREGGRGVAVFQEGVLDRQLPTEGTVRKLAWAKDGRQLAVSTRNSIQVWDPFKDEVLHTMPPPEGGVSALSWAPSATLAIGGVDGEVYLWNDFRDKSTATVIHDFQSPAEYLRFSPNGSFLATASSGLDFIQVWNASTGDLERTLRGFPAVKSLTWSAGLLQCVSTDGSLSTWNTLTELVPTSRSGSYSHFVKAVGANVQFSDDGKHLAVGRGASRWIFNVSSGTCLGAVTGIPRGHVMQISPAGHYFASADCSEDLVYVVELDSGERLTLSPRKFAERFGWRNDPNKARISLH